MSPKHALLRLLGLVLVVVAASAPRPLAAEPMIGDHCGVGIPSSEALGFVALPHGNVFCPLIADPKAAHSFISIQQERAFLESTLGAIGVADELALMRWGGPNPGEGFQIGLMGGVFAQFDLEAESEDLINADYVIGIPVTFRIRGFSGRARVYHQSSHLGDEFLLREDLPPERENLSFESAELLLSQEAGVLRLYAGGEYLFLREPETFEPMIARGGVELRQLGHLLNLGSFGGMHAVAALDVKLAEEQDWDPSWSARAGFEISRPHEAELPGRSFALLLEYYDGPSPYGQFYRDHMRFWGVGFHVMP